MQITEKSYTNFTISTDFPTFMSVTLTVLYLLSIDRHMYGILQRRGNDIGKVHPTTYLVGTLGVALPLEKPGTHSTGSWGNLGASLDVYGVSLPQRVSNHGPSGP